MQIVDRNRALVRSLGTAERALLIGYSEHRLQGHDSELANRLLRSIRNENHWLLCDCSTPRPVMHVALMDNGKLVLRNNPGTADHIESCPCGRDDHAAGSGVNKQLKTKRYDLSDRISLHSEFARGAGAGKAQPAKAPAGAPSKPVLSLLLTLCDDAGLNTYNPAHPLSLTEQFQRIRDAASRYTLANGMPLQTAMDTEISTRRMISLGKRITDLRGTETRPMGLLFDRVMGAKARKLLLHNDKTLDFFGHVERFGPLSPPLLAMATVSTEDARSRFFKAGHVALCSSVNERLLFPVGSEIERKLIAELVGLVNWMHAKGTSVTIQRHLFAAAGMPVIVLRGRVRVLSVIIEEGTLGDDHPAPISPDSIVYRDGEDIAAFKKRVAGAMLHPVGDAQART